MAQLSALRAPLRQGEGFALCARANCETPLAGWKRIDMLQQDLPGKDQGRAQQAGGLATIEDWFGKVAQGDPEA